jgi:HAD superfamily hydrolase (TIGR01509 family)
VKPVSTGRSAERVRPDKIKAILFDLDGTLIDTDDMAIAALVQFLRPLAPKRDERRLARQIVTKLEWPANALVTLLDILALDEGIFSLGDMLHKLLGHRTTANFRPVPGVIRALPRLRERYRLAVVTTRGRGDAGVFLAEYNLLECFAVVTTHEDTFRLKPHPAPVLLTARELGLPPEDCLMVGDTWVDVKSAVNAGAPAVGVLCGFGEREELEEAGASMILDHPSQLLLWCGA